MLFPHLLVQRSITSLPRGFSTLGTSYKFLTHTVEVTSISCAWQSGYMFFFCCACIGSGYMFSHAWQNLQVLPALGISVMFLLHLVVV